MRMPVGFPTLAGVGSIQLLVALFACADEGTPPGSERYQQVGTDIVREISTGLEWLAHDNGSETN